MEKSIKELQKAAVSAVKNSYSPYSRFRVGAALLTENDEIIPGSNIENRSYGMTVCAERSALFSALSTGHKHFTAMALYCPDSDTPVPPCGACRQVISEFVKSDFPVYYACKDGIFHKKLISELLPFDSLFELKKD